MTSRVVWLLLVMAGSLSASSFAADDGRRGFVEKVFQDDRGTHKYVVFVPPNYSPSRPLPVILFLHGAGERGTDGRAHVNVGLGAMINARAANFPAIAVFPQCEDTRGRVLQGWLAGTPDAQRALQILAQVEQDYRVDSRRRILTGWSMGAYGAWSIAAADPSRWSALVPVAGGGQSEWAVTLKDLPIWAWHGESDRAVHINRSREMIDALKKAGATPRFTEIPAGDHNSWKVAYADDRLFAWMFDPKGFDPDQQSAAASAAATPLAPKPVFEEPFIPALEISNAFYARLGNQMLEALAYAAPPQIPKDMLRGRINDIVDFTNVEGYGFRIQFSGISYDGQVSQVRVKATGKDRLNLQVGLSNAVLNIGGTWVTGEDHSAQAGPIQIVIGHRRPVWLDVDVQPYVANRVLRLKPTASRFSIPWDNWYVTSPAGVSVSGFGMTREKVSSGLVNGLYGNKQRIESEVLAVVPKLIATIEKKMAEFGEVDTFADRFWPLPVYKPRTRIFPQSVSTDENGLTLVMGLSAASLTPGKPPQQPEIVKLPPTLPENLSELTSLQAGLAPGILEPLTRLLIQADVARIHLLDIPENSFAKLADRATLVKAVPELKRYDNAELWSELSLVEGIRVEDITKDDGPTHVRFHAPKLRITTSLRKDGTSLDLTPVAIFEVDVKQTGFVEFIQPTKQTRAFRFGWTGDPEISLQCRFADGYNAADGTMDQELIQQHVLDGWKAWTGLAPVSTAQVPDLDFGLTRLRLSSAGWKSPHLFAVFTPPGIKLTNLTDIDFVYETKGPYSDWSTVKYTLKPGKSHEFDIAYPLTYRRNGEMYTLAPGSHSEFRVPLKGGPPQLFQARDEP
jgi:predicted esterase